MAVTILDPTNEAVPVERQITPRPEVVKGQSSVLGYIQAARQCVVGPFARSIRAASAPGGNYALRQADIF